MQLEERIDQRPQHHLRVRDVEGDAGHPRPVSDPPQPLKRRVQRPVSGEEPRHEHDWLAQARRDLNPTEDRVSDEAKVLEVDPALEPHRWDRVPATLTAMVRDRGGGYPQPASTPVVMIFSDACHSDA